MSALRAFDGANAKSVRSANGAVKGVVARGNCATDRAAEASVTAGEHASAVEFVCGCAVLARRAPHAAVMLNANSVVIAASARIAV